MIGLRLARFSPLEATPAEWDAYHVFRRLLHQETEPHQPPLPDEQQEYQARRRAADPDWISGAVHGYDDSGAVVARASWGAEAESSADFEANGHLLWGWVAVRPDQRRAGIGTRLAQHLYEVLVHLDRRLIQQSVVSPAGQAFAERFGGRARQVQSDAELEVDRVDWERVDGWIADLVQRAPGYAVECISDRLPEALWAEYCAAKMVLMNLSPRDDLELGNWSYTVKNLAEAYDAYDRAGAAHHNVLVREPSGQIVAISDTVWMPSDGDLVQQHFTGVHPDHRGKGLGKAIKARMLRHLAARHLSDGFRRIRTGIAASNASMRAINDRLGFVEVARPTTYQIEREALARALADPSRKRTAAA